MEKNRVFNKSLTHLAYLVAREPKLALRHTFTNNIDSKNNNNKHPMGCGAQLA